MEACQTGVVQSLVPVVAADGRLRPSRPKAERTSAAGPMLLERQGYRLNHLREFEMKGPTFLAALVVASAPFASSAADQRTDRPAVAQAAAPAHVKTTRQILRLSDSVMDQVSAGDAPGIFGAGVATAILQGNLNPTNPTNGLVHAAINAAGNPPGLIPAGGNCTAGKCF